MLYSLRMLYSIVTNPLQMSVIGSVILGILMLIREKHYFEKTILFLFVIYVGFVMINTLLPNPVLLESLTNQMWWESGGINLIPFDMYPIEWYQFYLNIAMFIPLGMTLGYFRKINLQTFIIPVVCAASIEVYQFLLNSFSNSLLRSVDINDVIANSLGGWIGLVLIILMGVRSQKLKDSNLQ